jgi:hypothetical protein
MPPMSADYHRAWRLRHLDKIRERDRERHAARYQSPVERAKRRARALVQRAIARGDLAVSACERCGAKAEAHHDDYSKPLEVRWLCPLHHRHHHFSAGAT